MNAEDLMFNRHPWLLKDIEQYHQNVTMPLAYSVDYKLNVKYYEEQPLAILVAQKIDVN